MNFVRIPMHCGCCDLEKIPKTGREPMTMRYHGKVVRGWRALGKCVGLPGETARHRATRGYCLKRPFRESRPPKVVDRSPYRQGALYHVDPTAQRWLLGKT